MSIALIKRGVWLEAAAIARANTYMKEGTLDGGNFGGPTACEYSCGNVLADEFERRADEEEHHDKEI